MSTIRLLSLLVLVLVVALPAAASPALQTPPPTLTVTLTITTGADGTNDSPTIAFKTIDGAVLGSGALNQPGDLAPGVTNVYSYNVTANFCDITQFELLKPATSGSDDSWQISALRLTVDGTEVFVNLAPSGTITASSHNGGTWQGTYAYRDRCGALAWTLVELTVITGDDGTQDNLELEIGGSFPGAPYVQSLSQQDDLQPAQTDTYVFIVPMEFCEMTQFQLRKPATSGADDAWSITQLSLSIDATEVFFDSAIETFNPVTASSYPPNGNWAGVAAYTNRCSGMVSAPSFDPMLEIDLSNLIVPEVRAFDPQILNPSILVQPPGLRVVPFQITPQPTPPLAIVGQDGLPPVQVVATLALPPAQVMTLPPGAPVTCPGALPSRLVVGQQGRVTPGDPNNLRASASLQAQLVGRIPGSGAFTVLNGPQCADNMAWWEVDYNGLRGWTSEGRGNTYWLEPVQALG